MDSDGDGGGRVELIRRDRELGQIRRLMARARDGTGSALVVLGEVGVGKSALLDAIARDVGDVSVVRTQGIEGGEPSAYAGLAELCAPLREHVASLPEPQAEALAGACEWGPPSPGDLFGALLMGLGPARASTGASR